MDVTFEHSKNTEICIVATTMMLFPDAADIRVYVHTFLCVKNSCNMEEVLFFDEEIEANCLHDTLILKCGIK